jgi:diguanylate cyclase (GGDEF)-like protein
VTRTRSIDLLIISKLSGQPLEALEESPAAQAVGALLIRDGLTGLYNHQYFQRRLAMTLASTRLGDPFSILVVDLDGLKQVNDALGHAVGDQLIVTAARTLAAGTPASGFVVRYAGDEFVVALPGTPERDASAVAYALRDGLERAETRLTDGTALRGIRASFGVADSTGGARDPGALFAAADLAMFHAKRYTKEGVCAHSEIRDVTGTGEGRVGASAPQPSAPGMTTFLACQFGDRADLTSLQPVAMHQFVLDPDSSVSSSLQRNGGLVFKSGYRGNRLYAAFGAVNDALVAVSALCRLMDAGPGRTTSPGLIRVAIHTGEAELRGAEYTGAAVAHCGQLVSVANDGQVLLSAAAAERFQGLLPPGVSLHDHGLHRLRDLHGSEHLFQFLHPSLPPACPSPRSLDFRPHNLPLQPTCLVGREREMAEVRRLMTSTHLLTLIGPGGSGKTRLALQVAAELLDSFADGVRYVELAALSSPSQVPDAVAAAVGFQQQPDGSILNALADHLASVHLLLVLDNCEHLLPACRALADTLLRTCPFVRVLATSREALGIAGETVWNVPGLALPNLARLPASLEGLARYDGIKLFVARARMQQPDFVLGSENALPVLTICQRLDGLALALELAAARVRILSPAEILSRLDSRFQLLTGGNRLALSRHQTLRALVDWSHDLLTEPERLFWYRLSVFAGSFSLEAAEEICGQTGIEPAAVLDLLAQLVDKSLVAVEHKRETRYRLLETMRVYATEKLQASGAEEWLRRRHCDWYLKLVEKARAFMKEDRGGVWLDRLEAEQENLWEALHWSQRYGDLHMQVRFMKGLTPVWVCRMSESGQEWLNGLLAAACVDPHAWSMVLFASGSIAYLHGQIDAAVTAWDEALRLYRELGASQECAYALVNLAAAAEIQGDYERVVQLWTEAAAAARETTFRYPEARLTIHRIAAAPVDPGRLTHLLDETLDIPLDAIPRANVCCQAAEVARYHGQYAWAVAHLEEAVLLYRSVGPGTLVGMALTELGYVVWMQGDQARARVLFGEALTIYQQIGGRLKDGEAGALEGVATLLNERGDSAGAARLFGAAEQMREEYKQPLRPMARPRYEAAVAAVRRSLPEAALAHAWAEGRRMKLAQALGYALRQTGAQPGHLSFDGVPEGNGALTQE